MALHDLVGTLGLSIPVDRACTSTEPIPFRFGRKSLRWMGPVVEPLIRRRLGSTDSEPPAGDYLSRRVPTLTIPSDIGLDSVILG